MMLHRAVANALRKLAREAVCWALTQEQLEYRTPRIGGSDAAAICGKDSFKTAYAVALRITGQIERDDLSDKDHIIFGDEIEGVLARFYERKEKCKVYTPQTLTHPTIGFLIANIDRVRDDRMEIGIECKNTGLYTGAKDESEKWGDPGTDEVPDRVNIQVQHCMGVASQFDEFHVLRCYGGNTYQKFIVRRNAPLIESLQQIEQDFMSDLRRGIMPAPDYGHSTTSEVLRKAFRKINGEVVSAAEHNPELIDLTAQWRSTADARLAAEKAEKALKNKIVHLVGEAGAVLLPNGQMWRRKEIERDGYTVGPTKYIECRLVKQ